jgi:hypothetical protein
LFKEIAAAVNPRVIIIGDDYTFFIVLALGLYRPIVVAATAILKCLLLSALLLPYIANLIIQ